MKHTKRLGPFNGFDEFREYPKMLYNSEAQTRVVVSQEEEVAAGPAWKFRPDGSDPSGGTPKKKA